jgi:hypothetical protein
MYDESVSWAVTAGMQAIMQPLAHCTVARTDRCPPISIRRFSAAFRFTLADLLCSSKLSGGVEPTAPSGCSP